MNRYRQALLSILVFATGSALANEHAAQWNDEFDITLPEPVRNILLRRGVDAVAFLNRSGLEDARLVPQGRQTLIQAPMDEAAWDAAQSDLCQSGEVSACEASTCPTIQLNGTVDAAEAKARIVRNAPESLPEPDSEVEDAGMCRGAPLPPDLDPIGGATPQLNLTLDLAERDKKKRIRPNKKSFEIDVTAQANAVGGRALSANNLPADTTEHSLVVAQGCSTVSVPLDGLVPARVPGLITAVVTQGNAAAVAASHALILVTQADLASTGETIATFATDDNILQAIYVMQTDARVRAVQEEFIYRTSASAGYSDPYAQFTYGPRATRAQLLHPTTNGSGQTIAVIDTGVAVDHPELAGRVEAVDVPKKAGAPTPTAPP